MREIKFRAWYEKFNEMYILKAIDFQREMAYFDKYNYRSIYDIELMEYTGLKIKKEKKFMREIFYQMETMRNLIKLFLKMEVLEQNLREILKSILLI